MFRAELILNNQQSEQELYVVKDLQQPLLGQPAIEALGLLSRVRSVHTTQPEVLFPKLFKGLGKLSGEYRIQLKEGAKPFALCTPRRVCVISRVEEPTEWCAGMVVVPKSRGKVRICVDLTKLNTNVMREHHILPAVEQTLAQVSGARYFSKLEYLLPKNHPYSQRLSRLRADIDSTDYLSGSLLPPSISKAE